MLLVRCNSTSCGRIATASRKMEKVQTTWGDKEEGGVKAARRCWSRIKRHKHATWCRRPAAAARRALQHRSRLCSSSLLPAAPFRTSSTVYLCVNSSASAAQGATRNWYLRQFMKKQHVKRLLHSKQFFLCLLYRKRSLNTCSAAQICQLPLPLCCAAA